MGSHDYMSRANQGCRTLLMVAIAIPHAAVLIDSLAIPNTDIEVGLLDVALPETVVPAEILPEHFENCIALAKGLPVITLDQEEKALVMEVDAMPDCQGSVTCHSAHVGQRERFTEEVVPGDSGNPRFLVVEDKLLLLHTLWHGGRGDGILLTSRKNEIQAAMDSLCPGFQLQEFDFSDYAQLLVFGDNL